MSFEYHHTGLGGRGMTAAEMLGIARLAQKATLEGNKAEAARLQQSIRGAPGEVMADIAAAGAIKQNLDSGNVEAARQLEQGMTGTSIKMAAHAAQVGAPTVPAVIAAREQALAAQAQAAQGPSRLWVWLLGGGVLGVLTLWWVLSAGGKQEKRRNEPPRRRRAKRARRYSKAPRRRSPRARPVEVDDTDSDDATEE